MYPFFSTEKIINVCHFYRKNNNILPLTTEKHKKVGDWSSLCKVTPSNAIKLEQ